MVCGFEPKAICCLSSSKYRVIFYYNTNEFSIEGAAVARPAFSLSDYITTTSTGFRINANAAETDTFYYFAIG